MTESRGAILSPDQLLIQQFAKEWEAKNPGKRADEYWDQLVGDLLKQLAYMTEDRLSWRDQALKAKAEVEELRAAPEAEEKELRRLASEPLSWRRTAEKLQGEVTRLRSQGEGQWVSVEERLPEVGGTYLVWAKFADPFKYGVDFGHFFKLESGPTWTTSGSHPLSLTHWMPFPHGAMRAGPWKP